MVNKLNFDLISLFINLSPFCFVARGMGVLEHSVTSQFLCNCLSPLFSAVILKVRCHHSYNRGIRQAQNYGLGA